MKLSTKMLGMPIGVMMMVFLIMGIIILSLLSSNLRTSEKNELTNVLRGIEKQLHTGLSIVTSASLPATAFLALEGNDDGMAIDLMKQVKSMGLDATYITNLNGKVLFPKESVSPNGLSLVLEKAMRNKGSTHVLLLDQKMIGYAPIVDVETTKGFLVFAINLPQGFMEVAQATIGNKETLSDTKNDTTGNKAASYFENAQKGSQSLSQGEILLRKMAVAIGTIMLVGLISIAIVLIWLTRSISQPINRAVAGLTTGAEQVAAAALQVSSSSQQLAEGTSEQASSLEETSSSLEEMSSMTKQNADNSNQAKAMMAEVRKIVEKVNGHMGDMVKAIDEITSSSQETGKIIKTIDEIAFQTNLLALNAAVEAARAGEAGAGFAVVADEVRNLALRAADAAKNTSNLIENTIKAVRNGNELTRLTQEAFKENADISGKVEQLVDEIAAASQEQSQGIGQVNTAVAAMDKVTQSTAANAEESAAASEELNAQAEQMKTFVADLVQVVGGSANRSTSLHSALDVGHRSRGGAVALHKALPIPEKKTGGKAGRVQGAKVARRPEEVIPMTGGEFKDF